jgi:DNA-binding transcriptional regulator GbsR (MarR family)
LRTGSVIFGLIDGVLFMVRKKAAKLTDEQLAKRVFSPGVRKQLKEALTALAEVQKAQEKRKKR